ncbi:2Fe-2S iron-sulfur cluster-binding protein [Orrella sp. 11846]|uniref:2Fe-2S iron-sulfur cluster-binding protein n=1 Tax=Orrella sp. 11846 TaxID=3409913 RepID=UPI003B5AE280
MPKIIFMSHDGIESVVEANSGQSLMQAAVQNGVSGIEADCGGSCACATCHVYVDEAWLNRLPPIQIAEEGMLEFALDMRDNSRLSCQIPVTDELDGLVLYVPQEQA